MVFVHQQNLKFYLLSFKNIRVTEPSRLTSGVKTKTRRFKNMDQLLLSSKNFRKYLNM